MYNYNNYNPYYFQPRSNLPMYGAVYGQEQMNNTYVKNISPNLQGRIVDNTEVVKAIEIPLDGSISYFPLADGSMIITKQLQQDGTSKTNTYSLVSDENTPKTKEFVTIEEFNEAISKIENNGFKDEIKGIKRQVKDLLEDLEELKTKKG